MKEEREKKTEIQTLTFTFVFVGAKHCSFSVHFYNLTLGFTIYRLKQRGIKLSCHTHNEKTAQQTAWKNELQD